MVWVCIDVDMCMSCVHLHHTSFVMFGLIINYNEGVINISTPLITTINIF
jgi:hypothetical protein